MLLLRQLARSEQIQLRRPGIMRREERLDHPLAPYGIGVGEGDLDVQTVEVRGGPALDYGEQSQNDQKPACVQDDEASRAPRHAGSLGQVGPRRNRHGYAW